MKKAVQIVLAVSAMIVLNALMASPALGVNGEWDFGSEVEDTFVKGEQKTENILTLSIGTFKCATTRLEGTIKGTQEGSNWLTHEATLHPTYEGCPVFGQNLVVTTTGCNYVFAPSSTTAGSMSIECEAGKNITFKDNAAGCTITIGAQTPTTSSVDLTEESTGSTRDILITTTIKGITYTSSGGVCGSSGSNGEFSGTITTKGYSNAEHSKQVGAFLSATGPGEEGTGEWDFASEAEDTFLTAEQVVENIFTVNGGTAKCKSLKFEGTAKGNSFGGNWVKHEATLHPVYENCTTFGQAGTVTTTGCNYVFAPSATTTGSMRIECEAGKSIVIKASTAGCTVTIGAQTPLNNNVDLTEEGTGSARDVLVTSTIGPEKVVVGEKTGLTYTSSGGICGASGENGKYRGTITTKGFSNAEHSKQVGVFLSSTATEEGTGEWDFASEVEDTFVKGEQKAENVLTFNGGTLRCTTIRLEGTAKGKLLGSNWLTHEATLHPSYEGCTAFGQSATVTTTGCNYVFTASATAAGTMKVECEAGKLMIVTTNTADCTVTINAQTPVSNSVDLAEEGTAATRDVVLTQTVGPEKVVKGEKSGLTYTSSGGVCGESGENGSYRGSFTVKGYSDEKHEEQKGLFLAQT